MERVGTEKEGEMEHGQTEGIAIPGETQSEIHGGNPGASAGRIVIICIVVSIICGGLSGLLAAWQYWDLGPGRHEQEIVTVDIGDIVSAKKRVIIEKYKGKEDTEPAKAEMEKEITEFFKRLNAAVAARGGDRIVLAKDAVLSGGKDITEEVEKEMNGK